MAGQAVPVYLSPHHDDICFSLGSLVQRLRAGRLVNIFTVSSYTERDPPTGPEDYRNVSRLRDAEDERFARQSQLTRHDLHQIDCPLRGRDPFDASELDDEVGSLRRVLSPLLGGGNRPPVGRRPLLFCPAGIGMHRDHLIVRNCILADYAWLQQLYRIVFYEELHYASVLVTRQLGVHMFLAATEGLGYTRRYTFIAAADKLSLLRCYASQFSATPTDLSAFTPADGSGEPHEAVWSNTPIAEFERHE